MKRINLLLADDDEDDRLFFEEAFSEIAPESTIVLKKDGLETLGYLTHPQAVLPDIIFLDLNMPLINGVKCLEEIRNNRQMNSIFIVMYTTTASQREIDQVFERGANLFLIKPNSFSELKNSISVIIKMDFYQEMCSRQRSKFVFNLKSFE